MARSQLVRRLAAYSATALVAATLSVSTTTSVLATSTAGMPLAATLPASPRPAPPVTDPTRAARSAAALVADRPAALRAGPDDTFTAQPVISSGDHRYVPYERAYRGLPVVGGDFVVTTDATGAVTGTSVAQTRAISGLSTTPTLSRGAAATVAKRQLRAVTKIEGSRLVVYALGAAARLAWETIVDGVGPAGVSRLTVDVDAVTGAVIGQHENVMADTGTGFYNGPAPLPLATSSRTIGVPHGSIPPPTLDALWDPKIGN